MKQFVCHWLLCVFLGSFPFVIQGQIVEEYAQFTLFFNDVQKYKTEVESITPTPDDRILLIQDKIPFINLFSKNKTHYSFDYVRNKEIPKATPIKFYGDGKKSNLIDYTFLGDDILGISYRSSFSGNSPNLFYHHITPSSKAKSNHGFPLLNFKNVQGKLDFSRLYLITNALSDYAALLFFPRPQKGMKEDVQFAIFDKSFTKKEEAKFSLQLEESQFIPLDFLIESREKQFFITGHYPYSKDNRKAVEHPFMNTVSIAMIEQGENVKTTTIGNASSYLFDVKTLQEEDRIIVTGTYGVSPSGNIEGVFFVSIDKEGDIIEEEYQPYATDIHRYLNGFQEIRGYSSAYNYVESYSYDVVDFHPIDDGYLHVVEYTSTELRYSGADFNRPSTTIDTYYWHNNIIVSKLNSLGEILWSRVIPKVQRTMNDYGYYLSVASAVHVQEMHLFFNDNLDNYDENRQFYTTGDGPKLASFTNRKNTIAHVSINIETGDVERESTIGKEELDSYFVPRMSTPSPVQDELLLYSRKGKKHRVGAVHFK